MMEIQSLGFRTDIMVRRLSGSVVDERANYLVIRTPPSWCGVPLGRRSAGVEPIAVHLHGLWAG